MIVKITEMKRTFIGIQIKVVESFLNQLVDVRQRLVRERINWVNPERFHITLHFIGKSSDQLIESINGDLSSLIPVFSQQEIRITRLGVFPNVRKAKVLWADLEYGEQLIELRQSIVNIMKQHRQQIENREYKPHLTLGRVKYPPCPNRLNNVLQHYEQTVFDEQILEDVTFLESQLDRTGPRYLPLHNYLFNEAIVSRISR